MISILVAG